MKIQQDRPFPTLTWAEAVAYLKADGILAYPTDTVWGLGCRADNSSLSMKCLGLKGGDRASIASVITIPEKIRELVVLPDRWDELLPGPYTLVLPLKTHTLNHISSQDHFLGCRIPNHTQLLQMVRHSDFPIITTSLNKTGHAPITDLKQAQVLSSEWGIKMIGEETRLTGASTVLKWDGSKWILLRKGIGPIPHFTGII